MITNDLAIKHHYNPKDKAKPSFISDSTPYGGLRLAAYRSGTKTWFYRYRNKISGNIKQIKIGSFSGDLDLVKAREIFNRHKLTRDLGGCPRNELSKEIEKTKGLKFTIEIMMEDYYTGHIELNRKKRSRDDFYMICKNTIYPLAGHIPAKYLDIELMTELSESINTPSRLDAVRVMLGAAFEWAIKTGTIHHSKRKHTYRIKTKYLTSGEYK